MSLNDLYGEYSAVRVARCLPPACVLPAWHRVASVWARLMWLGPVALAEIPKHGLACVQSRAARLGSEMAQRIRLTTSSVFVHARLSSCFG